MSFNKLAAYTQKVADAADQITGNPAAAKAIFDAAPEELRTYFNNLVDALKSTASGDSGAKNTGATGITGLTGTDVQTLLESIKTSVDNKPTTSEGTGFSIQRASGTFFTNGSSNSATANITFSKPFTQQPWVMPANITQVQAYGDTLLYPYIYNVTTTGFSVKIIAANGANLGTSGSPANIFMNFVAFGL